MDSHIRHGHHSHHFEEHNTSQPPYLSSNTNTINTQSPTTLPILFNFSNKEIEEMENFDNIHKNQTETTDLSSIYTVAIPIMLLFCLLTVIVNIVIVISAHWCRKPMSPTLYFSISLALADGYSTLVVGLGLIINSLLPKVYFITLQSDCISLTLEGFRLGGILVSNMHLLALAMNHWIGIARPLHYAATMTRRTAWIVIILSWSCPILSMFIIFSSSNGMGFRSYGCHEWNFLEERIFRSVFVSLFFGPLLLMSIIYAHIFCIVKNHQNHRIRLQSSHQLKKNIKAVMTTVLILGTYILGFMPATLFNIVVCKNCSVDINSVPQSVRISWGILVNTLVILKALVDPIIYAARMADIQVALRKMRYEIFKHFCGSCTQPLSPEFERGYSTKYARSASQETKSMRASSFGSNSSWKKVDRRFLTSSPQVNSIPHNSSQRNYESTNQFELKEVNTKHN